MILKIEGSDKKIKQLARELKVRARKSGLELSFEEAAKKVEAKKGSKLKALEAIALIQKVENLEDLEQFESDDRVTVVEALNLRKEELDLA